MPPTFDEPIARAFSKRATKLVNRDDGNGGLKGSTKIGIAIGLICFFTLLVSFWYIANRRRRARQLSKDEQFGEETLSRWVETAARPTRTSTSRLYGGTEHMRRESNSTFATATTYKEPNQVDEYELARPSQAHTSTHL